MDLKFELKEWSKATGCMAIALLVLLMGLGFSLDLIIDEQDCGFDSAEVALVRNLTSERLSQLYNDMESDFNNPETPVDGWGSLIGEEIPKSYNDLMVARIRPTDGNIMLAGCLDHFSMIYFSGFGKTDTGKKYIELWWGEPRSELSGKWIIWRADGEIEPLPEEWPVKGNLVRY